MYPSRWRFQALHHQSTGLAPRNLPVHILEAGGKLSTALIAKYPTIDGVKNGISAAFHSGGWTGPTSLHLKRKREKLRDWLTRGFEFEVTQWIESELEYIDIKIEREEIAEERTRFD